MINMCKQILKFVKWAGGKGQLIEQFEPLFPKKFKRYIEPFVGSGAVFFHIIQNFKRNFRRGGRIKCKAYMIQT